MNQASCCSRSAIPNPQSAISQIRRHFFRDCGVGLGSVALASLLTEERLWALERSRETDPLAPQPTHHPAKAKSVIYLFMAGGPSQLELFSPKPKLQELDGQVVPPSVVENKRFAFLKPDAKLLG